MLTSLFPNTHNRYSTLPVLGDALDDICSWLEAQGYPQSGIRRRIQAAPLLEQCLQQQQVHSLAGCSADALRACFPREERWTPQIAYALGRSLLEYLKEKNQLAPAPVTASGSLVQLYRDHLIRVRGFTAATIERHAVVAGEFLHLLRYDGDAERLRQIIPADLERFVGEASARVRRITMQKVVAIVRCFLRFLATSSLSPIGLDRYVESPRHYRGERLVRVLPWDHVVRLLQAIDRSTTKGCRNYSMLLLIATYGLRRSEVSSIRLEDVRWRTRVICVPRPKIGTALVMPLTDEIASALMAYLRHRSSDTGERQLFLRVRAPRGPIEATAVSDAFDFWAARAGVRAPGLGGPHCLRHGVAMHLLRQGTPLKTIGDLLGHRTVESTGVYLRLQVEDLRDVALPLPAGSCPEVG